MSDDFKVGGENDDCFVMEDPYSSAGIEPFEAPLKL